MDDIMTTSLSKAETAWTANNCPFLVSMDTSLNFNHEKFVRFIFSLFLVCIYEYRMES